MGDSTLSADSTLQEISSVKLDAWLVGENFHRATSLGVLESGSKANAVAGFQYPTMIITGSQREGLEIMIHAVSDGRGIPEIQWRSLDWSDFAGGNESSVNRKIAGSEQLEVDGH
jgi:hypothetical protein